MMAPCASPLTLLPYCFPKQKACTQVPTYLPFWQGLGNCETRGGLRTVAVSGRAGLQSDRYFGTYRLAHP